MKLLDDEHKFNYQHGQRITHLIPVDRIKKYITKMKVRTLFLTIGLMIKNNKNLKIEDLMFKNSAKMEFMKFQDSISDSHKI